MKTQIEISELGNDSGKFKVWAKIDGTLQCVTVGQQDVQDVLNRRQEEEFFFGERSRYKFRVPVYDAKEFFTKHSLHVTAE